MDGEVRLTALSAMVWLAACTGAGGPHSSALVLDGASRVTVDRLGAVDLPALHDGEGDAVVDGVVWQAEPNSVAHVRDGELHAVGPGEAQVTARWHDQRVTWTLVVEPALLLVVVDPPARVQVGEAVSLRVEGRVGDAPAAVDGLLFEASEPAVLAVDAAGVVTGVSPGVGYVTVSSGRRTEALVEVEVVAGE